MRFKVTLEIDREADDKSKLIHQLSDQIEIFFDNELYEIFIDSSDEESKRILTKEILNSLSNLDSLPKKVKKFDKETFRNDFRLFFEERGLI